MIVRNDSPGLAITRASIAAQVGARDFEWLIVDGASDDAMYYRKSLILVRMAYVGFRHSHVD
jgi:hypothetical protein